MIRNIEKQKFREDAYFFPKLLFGLIMTTTNFIIRMKIQKLIIAALTASILPTSLSAQQTFNEMMYSKEKTMFVLNAPTAGKSSVTIRLYKDGQKGKAYKTLKMKIRASISPLPNLRLSNISRTSASMPFISSRYSITHQQMKPSTTSLSSTGVTIRRTIMCRKAATVPTLIRQEPASRSSRRW